jgi:predicted nucleic acid-binding protein
VDAFDADVLIYAASADHPLGPPVRELFSNQGSVTGQPAGIGSVLLIPELLTKPARHGDEEQALEVTRLLGRLDLQPVDQSTAELATALGAKYGLAVVDAIHLATAVAAGADRFITNNAKHFSRSITEIDVTTPEDLAQRAP